MFARLIPPWAWAIAGAAILALAFGSGFRVASWRCEASRKAAIERQFTEFQEQLARQNTEATEYERDRQLAAQESRVRETTIREIYRDVPVPAQCEPPAGALGVLDDAISAANARASGEPSR